MRILVLSDIHSDALSASLAIKRNPEAEYVFFLGDGIRDWENLGDALKTKKTAAVRGNCDSSLSQYPLSMDINLEGKKIYLTHGHAEHVKFGLEELISKGRERKADIILFGHTHNPMNAYEDGLYLLNPGSVRENSCGIVDITPGGIMCYAKPIVPYSWY